MTALKLFGALLLLIPSTGAGAALLVVLIALVVLAVSLAMPIRAQLDEETRRRADNVGLGVGTLVLVALSVGLRLEPTAFLAQGGLPLLRILATAATSLGLSTLAATAAVALTGASAQAPRVLPTRDSPGARRLQRARQALLALRTAVERLEQAHDEARTRAEQQSDPVVVDGYQRTADAIAEKLELGRELIHTATRGLLQLSCRTALESVIERRPDQAIAEVSARDSAGKPVDKQLQVALTQLEAYLDRLFVALWRVKDEAEGAPGSLAYEFDTAAGDDALPVRQALEEMSTSYDRARHQLEALRLRRSAEAGAGAAVSAASAMTRHGQRQPAPADSGTLALEIASTEAAAERALEVTSRDVDGLGEAVDRATALLEDSDEAHLRDVLQSMREVSDQLLPGKKS